MIRESKGFHLFAKDLHTSHAARQTGQMKRRRPEVIALLKIDPGVHQQPDDVAVALVSGPMEGRVAVDVHQMVLSAHAQQVSRRRRSSEHGGRHQRRQSLEVGRVNRHASLKKNLYTEGLVVLANNVLPHIRHQKFF